MMQVPEMNVLEEASYLVDGSRREQYGPAHKNFQRIAAMWEAYLGIPINMDDVAFMMVLLKISRHVDSPTIKRDNVVDSIGYLRLIEIIREETKGTRLKDGS